MRSRSSPKGEPRPSPRYHLAASWTIDGLPRTTPYVHDSVVNFTHNDRRARPSAGGSSYTFASRSDSATSIHNITGSATNRAYAATFNATAPLQLLAAYGLNEGSGATSQDTSGNANTLTLTSTTWTTSGRSSNALSFNGTSFVPAPPAPWRSDPSSRSKRGS